jgi:hypothetical protein
VPARLAHHRSSGHERRDAQLRRHQPDQAPGRRLLERLTVKLLILGRHEHHHPAGMVDGPVAGAAARRNGTTKRCLQLAGFERGVNTRLRHSAGEVGREGRGTPSRHQRCATT